MSSVGFLIFDGLWREISARVNRFVRSASGRTAEKRRNLARSKMRGFLRAVGRLRVRHQSLLRQIRGQRMNVNVQPAMAPQASNVEEMAVIARIASTRVR